MSQSLSHFGKEFVSYATYHSHRINRLIHFIAAPLMTITLIAILNFIPYSLKIKGWSLGVGDAAYLILLLYYFTLHVPFATAVTIISAILGVLWEHAFSGIRHKSYVKWVLGLHVLSWVLNIVGHKIFQKRTPSLTQNISTTGTTPMFSLILVLDMLGYRSQEMGIWFEQVDRNLQALHEKEKEK